MRVIGRMVQFVDAPAEPEPRDGALAMGIVGVSFALPWLSYDPMDGEVIVVMRGGEVVGGEPTWTLDERELFPNADAALRKLSRAVGPLGSLVMP